MAWVWERIRTSLKQLNFDHLERIRRREETEVEVAQEAEVSDFKFFFFFHPVLRHFQVLAYITTGVLSSIR